MQFSQTLDSILKKTSKEGQTVKACWSEAAISEKKSSDIDNRSAAKDLKVDSKFCKGLYIFNLFLFISSSYFQKKEFC
jgi:hypothetical protein